MGGWSESRLGSTNKVHLVHCNVTRWSDEKAGLLCDLTLDQHDVGLLLVCETHVAAWRLARRHGRHLARLGWESIWGLSCGETADGVSASAGRGVVVEGCLLHGDGGYRWSLSRRLCGLICWRGFRLANVRWSAHAFLAWSCTSPTGWP